jgi:hypothetical protein
MRRLLASTALLVALPLTLEAQTGREHLVAPAAGLTAPPKRASDVQPYNLTVSINPIALPFGWFSAEFEQAVGPGVTFGVGASYLASAFDENDDSRDAWVQGKLKYYPGEIALRGFSVGLTAGYHSARRNDYYYSCCDVNGNPLSESRVDQSEGAPTIGVVLDYNWLIGRSKRFLVGTGIGARRVLTNVDYDSPLAQVYPDGRLQLGFAF